MKIEIRWKSENTQETFGSLQAFCDMMYAGVGTADANGVNTYKEQKIDACKHRDTRLSQVADAYDDWDKTMRMNYLKQEYATNGDFDAAELNLKLTGLVPKMLVENEYHEKAPDAKSGSQARSDKGFVNTVVGEGECNTLRVLFC